MKLKILLASAALTAAFGLAGQASADSLKVTYFTLANGDADTGGSYCCSTSSDEVLGALGPDGLPVYNAAYGGPTLHDVNGNGELTWWSPADNPNVVQTGTGMVNLPLSLTSFYPPNGGGSSDAGGYQTAIFTGELKLPTAETVAFTLGADDDAIVAVDGTVVDQLGGVHSITDAAGVTSMLSAGTHTLTIFYADRDQVDAALDFSIQTSGVTLGVPEPATWAMMLIGFGGMGAAMRRKRALAATA
jgi:hypothetical protein